MNAETLERPAVVDDQLKALDFDVLCEIEDCEHLADWWNICLACGAHTPVCDRHRREEVRVIESDPGLLVVCDDCHQAVQGRVWRRLFAFVPIGRT